MFFNADVLTKRKSGFAVYWLAATLAQTAAKGFAKLSKKQLAECAIVKACDRLIEPEEPLSLRLMSNLMLGIVRVYSQQTTFLFQDVTQLQANILKSASSIREAAIANINTGAGTAAVDLPEGGNAPAASTTNAKGKKSAKNAQTEATARKDAITRKSGATDLIAVDMVGLGFDLHDSAWERMQDELNARRPSQRGASTPGLTDYDDIASVAGIEDDADYLPGKVKSATIPTNKATGERTAQPSKKSSTVARLEDTLLPAHQDEDFGIEYQYDLDGPGIDPGFELGLDDVDDLPPPLSTLAPRRSSIGTSLTGLSGLSPRSAGVGDVHHDFAAVDRLSPPMDLDLPDHHTDFNNNHNDLFDMMNDDFPAPRPDVGQNDTASDRYRSESHLPTPPRSPERGEVDGANPATGGGQAAKTAKKQKKRTAIRDERVEMAPTAIAQNRDNYTEDIKAQNTKKAIEKQNERLRLNATKALQGVGMLGIQAPMLVKYLQAASMFVSDRTKVSSEDGVGNKRKRAASTTFSEQGRDNDRGVELPDEPQYDFNDNFFGQDQYNDNLGRVDSARPESAIGRGREGSLADRFNEYSSQIGRRDSRAPSLGPDYMGYDGPSRASNQSMPWNEPFEGGLDEEIPGLDASRRRSSGTPEILRARSRTPSIGGTSAADAGRAGSPLPSRIGSPAFSAARSRANSRRASSVGATGAAFQASQQSEGETQRALRLDDQNRRFLDYAKRKARASLDNEFLFSDIAPILTSAPGVAAQAFHHVLVLASRRQLLVLEQQGPYGEIRLAVPVM